jgi:ubiquinone/menaquinone biosynthesis C-methylase UbiE
MIVREYWATTAEHYDRFHTDRCEDVEFWKSVASVIDGPVLEIACGTGRVGIEIARQGQELYGIDQSEDVLEVFRRKLISERPEVQARVHLSQGDMKTFNLQKKFSLAIIPFRPLQHMLTLDDQLAALKNARRHLIDGGTVGFDVFFPNYTALVQPNEVEKFEREWTDSNNRTVRRFFLRHRVDTLNQVIYASFIFRTYSGEDLVSEEISPINMSYYTYPHLKLLLQLSGFKPMEEYGSYDRSPITSQKEMIFLARAI